MSELEKKIQDYLCYLHDRLPEISGTEWGNAYYELTKFKEWVEGQEDG